MKLKVTEEKLLNLMLKYNEGRPRAEVIKVSVFIWFFLFMFCIFCSLLIKGNTIICSAFSQTKLKSAIQLQDLLDATRMLVPRTRYHFLSMSFLMAI